MTQTMASDRPVARLLAAAICILYGFAKLNGSQFTVLDSELTRPLGEVSGFWLTWHYFGYSPIYGTLIALIQVAGGLLLIWPRTALLAALMLVPVAANILLIDLFYGVDPGGTLMAAVLVGCLARVIAPHVPRLRDAVITRGDRPSAIQLATAAALLAGAFALTFWAAHYNNRVPTAIDGVWTVVSDTQEPARWRIVFFERNHAHKAVFRAPGQRDTVRHFRVAGDAVHVRERWLDERSAMLMTGTFDGDSTIRLELSDEAGGGAIELERVER